MHWDGNGNGFKHMGIPHVGIYGDSVGSYGNQWEPVGIQCEILFVKLTFLKNFGGIKKEIYHKPCKISKKTYFQSN